MRLTNLTHGTDARAASKIIAQCAAGILLSAAVAGHARGNDPEALAFGSNFSRQSGIGTPASSLIATPVSTANLGTRGMASIAAGTTHSLFLADDHTVYSVGDNATGRTGLNFNVGFTLDPTPINTTNLAGKTISQVAAGATHSLLLATDGTVFAFGDNNDHQLGVSGVSASFVARPITATNLTGKTISQISAGFDHSLLLATDGTVFSFGSNAHGEAGQNLPMFNTPIAQAIDASNLGGKAITQVSAGHGFSLLLAEDGAVYAMGRNDDGRAGLGSLLSAKLATQIDSTNLGGKTITQVSAGSLHSLLLASDGTVFAVGSNANGRTGLNTDAGAVLAATAIDATNLGGKKVTQVAAGGSHSVLLTEDGSVFTFGLNSFGITGLNVSSGNTLIAAPIDATNLAGKDVTQISAGSFHTLLIATSSSQPGDFDLDNDVDGEDFLIWQRGESPSPLSDSDFADWKQHFGVEAPPTSSFGLEIPEPQLALWLGLMVGIRTGRTRRATT